MGKDIKEKYILEDFDLNMLMWFIKFVLSRYHKFYKKVTRFSNSENLLKKLHLKSAVSTISLNNN